MQEERNATARIKAVVSILIAVAVISGGFAVSAAPAAANRVGPHTHDRTDTIPTFNSGQGSKEGTNCGFWGCRGGHFWRVGGKFKATYYLGDVQGTFKFKRKIPQPDRNDLTGKVKWSVYEKRTGSSGYKFVKSFYPASQKGRSGWGTFRTRLELDGRVKIVATARTDNRGRYGTVGLSSVELKFVDLLPEMVPVARRLCEAGVVRRLLPWVAIPSAIAAAVTLVYAAPLVAGGGIAAITLRAARVLSKALPSTDVGRYLVEDEIQGWVLEEVWDYLSREVPGIWEDAVSSYRYGCQDFRASWEYLGDC